VLGPLNRNPAGVMMEPKFREGFAELGKRGLSFDAWMLEPQLPELIDLARQFPDTPIVLDHVGTPLGAGSYKGKLPERFSVWRENIRELAKSPNVHVKLGGLAMPFCNFPSMLSEPRAVGATGEGMGAVYRNVHRGFRAEARNVREQLPGR
jgi:L-fuconolactonase